MACKGDEMSPIFSGSVALVAGGTGGLGRAVSLALLEEGADVVVTYRQEKEFSALKNDPSGGSSKLTGQQVDVTDEQAVRQFVDGVAGKHGHLDILVNSIGAYAGGTKLWETEPKVFDTMLALNLRSGYVLSR